MLDVRRLRVLCAVADHPSLSAAAEALSYTPSAVSQSIVALEREVGVRLLHRSSRGVTLTATGRTLVEHARPILTGIQAAEASLAALTGLHEGKLHLASFATAGATILPEAIAVFRATHPDVGLTLTQADPEQAMVMLCEGGVDLIITTETDDATHERVEVVRLLEDPLFAVVPEGHRLAEGEALRLEDMAAETWVDAASTSEARRLLLKVCGQAGFIPRVAFESDEYAAVAKLVAAGAGVALIPGLALETPPAGVAIRPLLGGGVARHIAAAVHAPEYRAPAAEVMLVMLQKVAEARQAGIPF